MTLQMETATNLLSFLDGRTSAQELERWIVSVSDDPSFSAPERDTLEGLRLLLLEVGEGTRPPYDLRAQVYSLLGKSLAPE